MNARAIAVLVGVGLMGVTRVSAQTAQRDQLEYAVKFVCGSSQGARVAPGAYFTAINLHNPGPDTLRFRLKAAVTDTLMRPGRISGFVAGGLLPDEAMEVDCTDIGRLLRLRGFQKGFVVILSPAELDVVAVYTAAGSTRQVETMDVERVAARRLGGPGCPDLAVESINEPVWDPANKQSVITATIRNIGASSAGTSYARLEDPSTAQPGGGPPYTSVAITPPLAPNAAAAVTFTLPYWVYNPDAEFHVTADYKAEIAECREDNNRMAFNRVG